MDVTTGSRTSAPTLWAFSMSLAIVRLGWGGAHAGGSYDDQSTGYLLPTNLWVCIQLRRPDPDIAKINWVISFFVVGVQGTVQVLTIVIMAQFVTGL
jgi:hypothetical protein